MVSDIIKNSGLFILFVGIIILVITFFKGVDSNTGLTASFLLIIIGFVAYLLTNRYMND